MPGLSLTGRVQSVGTHRCLLRSLHHCRRLCPYRSMQKIGGGGDFSFIWFGCGVVGNGNCKFLVRVLSRYRGFCWIYWFWIVIKNVRIGVVLFSFSVVLCIRVKSNCCLVVLLAFHLQDNLINKPLPGQFQTPSTSISRFC
jgi:hypothetical protein